MFISFPALFILIYAAASLSPREEDWRDSYEDRQDRARWAAEKRAKRAQLWAARFNNHLPKLITACYAGLLAVIVGGVLLIPQTPFIDWLRK